VILGVLLLLGLTTGGAAREGAIEEDRVGISTQRLHAIRSWQHDLGFPRGAESLLG
jgi:hypothetical protein